MTGFLEAFGGLIGVGLIGIALVSALVIADWIMIKLQRKRGDGRDDENLQ
jgi:hypothetical protein